jgi:hypothetical protein
MAGLEVEYGAGLYATGGLLGGTFLGFSWRDHKVASLAL